MRSIDAVLRRFYRKFLKPDSVQALKKRGLTIGKRPNIQYGVDIDWSHCWHISIGDDVTLAPRVHILAHDASTKKHLGLTRIGKVEIGDRVFIGASSIVLPGVTIGSDVVIGAGSVVSRNIPTGVAAAGNPAKVICSLDDYLSRRKEEIARVPCFGEEYTDKNLPTAEMKAEMNSRMNDGIGYIV